MNKTFPVHIKPIYMCIVIFHSQTIVLDLSICFMFRDAAECLEVLEQEMMVISAAMNLHCMALLDRAYPRFMKWIFLRTMPQVQDRSLNLLIISPAR